MITTENIAQSLVPPVPVLEKSFAEAVQWHQEGNLPQAEAAYRDLLINNPKFAAGHMALGIVLNQLGKPEQAEQELAEAVRLEPRSPETLNNYAKVLLDQGKAPLAVKLFEQALAIRPDYAMAWNGLGMALIQFGRNKRAEAAFGKALALQPQWGMAHYNLGMVCLKMGKESKAESAFLQAIVLDESLHPALVDLAKLYEQQRDFAKAIACWEALRRYRPNEVDYLHQLGNLYRKLGRYDAACETLALAQNLDPSQKHVTGSLALSLASRGEPEQALALLGKLYKEEPQEASWMNLIGLTYLHLGRTDLAEAFFTQALIFAPHSYEIYTHLGRTYEQNRDWERAAKSYQMAFQLAPHERVAQFNMAVGFYRAGKNKEMMGYLNKILTQNPQDQVAHQFVSLKQLALGNWREGWRHYQWRGPRYRYEGSPLNWHGAEFRLPEQMQDQWIILRGEQGIGDELFFMRFLPMLRARGARIAYLPRSDKLPTILPVGHAGVAIDRLLTEAEIDDFIEEHQARVILVGDLPFALGVDQHPVTPSSIFLEPQAELVAEIREHWLAPLGDRPKIGLTWRAGTATMKLTEPGDALLYKEVPLAELLAAVAGLPVDFVILQRNPEPEELALIADCLGERVLDCSDYNDDLPRMLALLSQLDDVIGVSNANMHFLAALGKTAEVLVPMPGEFRWMEQGEESPWFPGFSMYRQRPGQGWQEPLRNLRNRLQERFGGE